MKKRGMDPQQLKEHPARLTERSRQSLGKRNVPKKGIEFPPIAV
jgi:hypothetical protein